MSVAAFEESLLSARQRDALLDWIGQLPGDGPVLRAFFSSIAFAALKPGEALALQVRDLRLPVEGAGEVVIRPGFSQAGKGEVRGVAGGRVVPACPQLVQILKAEVARWALRPGDALFTRDNGRPLSRALYQQVWQQARKAVLEEHEAGSPLGAGVSDLRDACIEDWLRGHRPMWKVVEVAERVGVSAASLLPRFPERAQVPVELTNALIEACYDMPGEGSGSSAVEDPGSVRPGG
ncbi:hypothetical protein [Streptomyces sp. YIM 98790]|uniref:hypothetical protein n=1 Tax=Streptomyces sp. YIM 98790 TaxID=2689077 RepID=UPI00140DB2A7|nr:hypothetical protein [Streptomyces sp. YIM 98790]